MEKPGFSIEQQSVETDYRVRGERELAYARDWAGYIVSAVSPEGRTHVSEFGGTVYGTDVPLHDTVSISEGVVEVMRETGVDENIVTTVVRADNDGIFMKSGEEWVAAVPDTTHESFVTLSRASRLLYDVGARLGTVPING